MNIFPEDASTVGYMVDELFYLALNLTSVAFFLVIATMAYFLIRYRAVAGRTGYYTHGDSKKAFGLTALLAIIVFVAIDVNLAIKDHHAWEATWGQAPMGDVMRVQVQGQQFAWNVRYAGADGIFRTEDDIISVNQLHVVVDKPVIVQLQSKDVIHSFFLPNFRVKQDAVPGIVTSLTFTPVKTGQYDIACAEHCGLGHYRMRGMLFVETEEDFNKWMTKQTERAARRKPDLTWGWDWNNPAGDQ